MKAHNYTSPNSVKAHVDSLIRSGHLAKIPGKARSIFLTDKAKTELGLSNTIPLLGKVSAGMGIVPQENTVEQLPKLADADFALIVSGDSMVKAGINNGDLVYVNQRKEPSSGDVIVALVDEEATVKYFYKENDSIILRSANDAYEDRLFTGNDLLRIDIKGVVVSLLRRY